MCAAVRRHCLPWQAAFLAACLANTQCCCSLIAAMCAVQKRKSIKKIRLADDLGEDDELDDMED